MDEQRRSERLGEHNAAAQTDFVVCGCAMHVLRPEPDGNGAPRERGELFSRVRDRYDRVAHASRRSRQLRLDEVHGWAADEARDEQVGGPVVELLRASALL